MMTFLAWEPAALRGAETPIRAAVLPFDNGSLTDRGRFDPYGRSLAEAFYQGLCRERGVQLIERLRLDAILSELQFQQSGLVDEASIRQLGRMIGVEVLILGSFSVIGDQVRLDGRVVAVETGEVLAVEEVTGATAAFFELEERLVAKILQEWKKGALRADREGAVARDSGVARGGSPPGRKASVRQWAVLPLEDLGRGVPGEEGETLAAAIGRKLVRTAKIEVVHREQMHRILTAQAAGGKEGATGQGLAALGREAGAEALLMGSYLRNEGRIKIHLRLVTAETGWVVAAATAVGKTTERELLTDRLVESILTGNREEP